MNKVNRTGTLSDTHIPSVDFTYCTSMYRTLLDDWKLLNKHFEIILYSYIFNV
jgi:hypothetical protein